MKWILAYFVGAVLLSAPVGLRILMRSEAAPQPVDAAAALEGRALFTHEWTVGDPLCPTGDGLGPVFNAASCAECHFQGGLGGGGRQENNITMFFNPGAGGGKAVRGVLHAHAISPEYQETLSFANPELPPLVRPTIEQIRKAEERLVTVRCSSTPIEISQRKPTALFGAKLIDDLPDHCIIANERLQKLRWRDPIGQGESAPVGRALRLADGRIGKFGWKAQSASLLEFVQAACASELGLGNPGQKQSAPLAQANYTAPGLDLTAEQCRQMSAFIAALPRPIEKMPAHGGERDRIGHGRRLFQTIGCAECHVPNLGSLEGVYSDLLLYRMGSDLKGGGSYSEPPPDSMPIAGTEPLPDEWRTPPLWGVADSAPYLHDGRAATLVEAILLHGGQARPAGGRFRGLTGDEQGDVLLFLGTLRAPE